MVIRRRLGKEISDVISLIAAMLAILGAVYMLGCAIFSGSVEGFVMRFACSYALLAQARKWCDEITD